MHFTFNFKNFEASDVVKDYAEKRFDKIGQFIKNEDNAEITMNFSVENIRHSAEVILSTDNLYLSAYDESEDLYATIDQVLDKMLAQVKKYNEKRKTQARSRARMDVFSFAPAAGEDKREKVIIESDHFEPKPMDVEEAAMQLEAKGDEFLVFHNAETDRVNVIYVKSDGNFGLIVPRL